MNWNYTVYERGYSLLNAPLFTLKSFTVLEIGVDRKIQTLAYRVGRWGGNSHFPKQSSFCSFKDLMSLLTFIKKNFFLFNNVQKSKHPIL